MCYFQHPRCSWEKKFFNILQGVSTFLFLPSFHTCGMCQQIHSVNVLLHSWTWWQTNIKKYVKNCIGYLCLNGANLCVSLSSCSQLIKIIYSGNKQWKWILHHNYTSVVNITSVNKAANLHTQKFTGIKQVVGTSVCKRRTVRWIKFTVHLPGEIGFASRFRHIKQVDLRTDRFSVLHPMSSVHSSVACLVTHSNQQTETNTSILWFLWDWQHLVFYCYSDLLVNVYFSNTETRLMIF